MSSISHTPKHHSLTNSPSSRSSLRRMLTPSSLLHSSNLPSLQYSTEGKLKEPNLAKEAGQGLLSAVSSYSRGDLGGVFKSAMGIVKTATGGSQKADKISKATKTSPADVISFSGCKDSQTSADTQEAGQATGAMSFAFISALSECFLLVLWKARSLIGACVFSE